MEIEDLVKKAADFPLSYNDIKYKKIIDEFVFNNKNIESWTKLEKELRKIKRKYKIDIKKMDLIASYKYQKLYIPLFLAFSLAALIASGTDSTPITLRAFLPTN